MDELSTKPAINKKNQKQSELNSSKEKSQNISKENNKTQKFKEHIKKKNKSNNKNRSYTKIIISCFILTIICFLLIGIGIILLIKQAQEKDEMRPLNEKIGIVQAEKISEIDKDFSLDDLIKKESGNITYYYSQKDEKYYKTISTILSKDVIKKIISDININFYIYTKFDEEDIQEAQKDVKIYDYSPFIISGNNIFLIRKGLNNLEDPEEYIELLISSLINVKLFNSLSHEVLDNFDKDNTLYSLNDSDLLKQYAEITNKNFTENNELANDLIHDSLIFMIKEDYKEVDENLQTFFKNKLNIKSNSLNLILIKFDKSLYENIIQKLELNKSPLDYSYWKNTSFSDSSFDEIGQSQVYYNINQEKLDLLKKEFLNKGFKLIKTTEKQEASYLGGDQYNLILQHKSTFYTHEILIMVMDTSTLKYDCIRDINSYSIYCNDNSIYKNSGNVIKIKLGRIET